jgi:hypothetical protein
MMMKDLLVMYHEFAHATVRALNEGRVKPPLDERKADTVAGVMVIVGVRELGAPIGGSLNYDYDTGVWSVTDMPSIGVTMDPA